VAARPDLILGHLHHAVEVLGRQQFAELLRAVGVGPLADDQEAVVLADTDALIKTGNAGLEFGAAVHGLSPSHGLNHLGHMLGRGSAAAADNIDAVFLNKLDQPAGEVLGRQRISRLSVDHRGQAGVGHHADPTRAVLAEVTNVLAHLLGTGGAVEADDLDLRVGIHHGQGGGDVGAHQHGAGGLHRHLDHDRHATAAFREDRLRGGQSRLGLQDILTGFKQERIDAPIHQAADLLGVAALKGVKGGLPQRGQFRARADRADDEARMVGGAESMAGLSADLGGHAVQLACLLNQSELGQNDFVGPEGVGFDRIAADLQESAMDLTDDVRPAQAQNLGAVLQAPVIGQRQIERMDAGSHGSVEDQDAFVKCPQESRIHTCSIRPITNRRS